MGRGKYQHSDNEATLDIKTCLKLIPIPWVVRRVLVPVSPGLTSTPAPPLKGQWWWGPKYIAYWRYASHPEVSTPLSKPHLILQNLTFAGSAG